MLVEALCLAVLVIAGLVMQIYRKMVQFGHDGLPPGPVPLPVIGNLHQMGRDAHVILMELAKKYGDVMRISIGSETAIVVSAIEPTLEGLVTKSVDYAGRPISYTLSLTTSGGKGIAFADYSPKWRLFRKLGHSSMKMFGSGIKAIEALVAKESVALNERFDNQIGKAIDPHYDLALAVSNVLCAMVFGHRYAADDEEFRDLMKSNQLFVRAFEYDSFIDVFPILRYLPNKRIKTIKYALSLRNPIIARELERHKANFDPENVRDLADGLLKASKEAIEEGKYNASYFEDEYLLAILDDMFGAGSETTVTVLRWTILYLAKFVDVQEKCYQELMAVVGQARLVDLSDRGTLPYVEATVLETLRLSSIAPFAVPHKTTCNTTLAGYKIQKGTQVIFNMFAIHRDTREWERPEIFMPERFLDENGQLSPPGTHRSFLPFSAGRRVCLAEPLAKMELFLLITQMICKFKFVASSELPLPDIAGVPGLFLGPKPYKVVIERRPAHAHSS